MYGFESYVKPTKYRVYVTWVDHASFIKDNREEPALKTSSMELGRNLHVVGFRLDGEGETFKYNIVVPQEIQGSFKVPQVGDIIVVEENKRHKNDSPVYIYSVYNNLEAQGDRYLQESSPIPEWGGLSGDYGHLRSHFDHTSQFLASNNPNFTKKFVKSITGYRFRKHYGYVFNTNDRLLEKGRFVLRGDPVFDVHSDYLVMNSSEVTSSGLDMVAKDSNSIISDRSRYPNPLNVPKIREVDTNYSYLSLIPNYLSEKLDPDPYKSSEDISQLNFKYYSSKLKVKNYYSYQPIIDKKYLEYSGFERELPAAEEYQVAIRGNNKLLIQDQFGDGEQIIITLKNQYDAGITIVHNSENSSVRVRDHLGQGFLIEGDPDKPRVVLWSAERQVIEMGSFKDEGEYLYLRNGPVHGKSDVSFGRVTDSEVDRNSIVNQEILMMSGSSTKNRIQSQLSSGIFGMIGNADYGIFIRNNDDAESTKEQKMSIYSEGNQLTTEIEQSRNNSAVLSSYKQNITNSNSTTEIKNKEGVEINEIFSDAADTSIVLSQKTGSLLNSSIEISKQANKINKFSGGVLMSEIVQNSSGVDINRKTGGQSINIGSSIFGDVGAGFINIGNFTDFVFIKGQKVAILR